MYESFYAKISAPFRTSSLALKAIPALDKLLTFSFYLSYPVLTVLLFLEGLSNEGGIAAFEHLFACVLSPALGFALVSWLRKRVNAARPYELHSIDALIHKETEGQSFPSKHVYSSFAIATCWVSYSLSLGAVFAVFAFCIALIRVIGGVHFPKDVITGALIGIAFGSAGLLL